MADGNRPLLARLLQIDNLIRNGEYPNCTRLANLFEVSTRTINRDLEFLREDLKAPVEYCPRNRGYFYTNKTYQLPWFQLTAGELTALFLSERMLSSVRGTPYEPLLLSLSRLEELLPQPVSISLRELTQVLSTSPGGIASLELERFQLLCQAVHDRRVLDLTYEHNGSAEIALHRVHPYRLTQSDWDWHLIVHCETHGEVKRFSLPRIHKVTPTGELFPQGEDFDPSGFLIPTEQSAEETVTLQFPARAADQVRRRCWHHTQSLTELPDGSLQLELRVNDPASLKRWILGWGGECKVLAPDSLRESIRESARAMLNGEG